MTLRNPAAATSAIASGLSCGAAGDARLRRRHGLAHVGGTGRADLGDERSDFGGDLVGAEARRQIAFEHLQLGLFLVDQILAAAGRELLDRVLALLDELVDDRDHCAVVEDDALVDLALLDRSKQAANGEQARRVLGAHGHLHVFGDAVLEGHGACGRESAGGPNDEARVSRASRRPRGAGQ